MSETIEDIVRELREQGKHNKENIDLDWLTEEVGDLQLRIADRVEAAVKHQFRDTTKMIPEEVAVAENATTTPRRNCDVYTMAEQSKRHEEFCKSHSTNGRCVKCPLWQMRLLGINCAIAWANFRYEKEGEK
jgi:hypothetical protein